MKYKLDLAIKDNFFTKKEYKIIVDNLNKISFSPMTNAQALYSYTHHFEKNVDNEWVFNKIKNVFFKNRNLEVYESRFNMRHSNQKILPHTDFPNATYNCLIYLKGEELMYNGTGFYYNDDLHTYVGFVQNRALFFNGGDVMHTNLQALGPSSNRFTLNIFYKET
jgi:hypothetical protein|tara:strand:- start:4468 stop:4962 length:495 start_codon:yes stop_codon:yes gene_type:complete